MKILVFLFIFPLTVIANDCQKTAQFVATVTEVEYVSEFLCRAKISGESISRYDLPSSLSSWCPLYATEVINAGIDFAHSPNQTCPVTNGQELSGVLVQNGQSIVID